MKVAIPTDDGLHISQRCENAKGFFVATVENGTIVGEEMRWNPVPDPADPRTAALAVIEDCRIVIAGEKWQNCINLQSARDLEIVIADETIITNVIVDYLAEVRQNKSNTCCCP